MVIRILALGFGPEPGQRSASAQGALTVLAAEGWAPQGAHVDVAVVPRRWWPDEPVATQAHDCVVLFSECGRDDNALVARFARNVADPRIVDAAGYCWAGPKIVPRGEEEYASGLEPYALARALELAGLPAQATSDCDAGIANKTFYMLRAARLRCALIRLPVTLESARAQGRRALINRCELLQGVQAAITFAVAAAEVEAGRAA